MTKKERYENALYNAVSAVAELKLTEARRAQAKTAGNVGGIDAMMFWFDCHEAERNAVYFLRKARAALRPAIEEMADARIAEEEKK